MTGSWAEYFTSYMQIPGIILENELFHGSHLIASSHGKGGSDPSLIEAAKNAETTASPVSYQGEKYLFVKYQEDDGSGYSLALYKKVKKNPDDAQNEVLFVSIMNDFLWVGKFDGKNRMPALEHVYNVSSTISSYLLQSEE